MNASEPIPKKGLLSRVRYVAARVGLLLGSLLFVVLLAEVGLRIAGVAPRTPTVLVAYFEFHPRIGWVGRPDADARFTTTEFDVEITHDEDGFRRCNIGSRIAEDATSTVDVVWCLGDSLTWGWGVRDGRTWVDHMNLGSDGRVYRNLGAPGYSSLQEYLLLRERLDRGERPDAVLLMFCHNDAGENVDVRRTRPYVVVENGRARIENEQVEQQFGRTIEGWLVNNSMVYNYLHFYVSAARRTDQPAVVPASGAAPALPARFEDDEQVALEFVYERLRDLCGEHSLPLWIAAPYGGQRAAQACETLGIPFIDLVPYFERPKLASSEPTQFDRDPHWNELGNRIVADALLSEIQAITDK